MCFKRILYFICFSAFLIAAGCSKKEQSTPASAERLNTAEDIDFIFEVSMKQAITSFGLLFSFESENSVESIKLKSIMSKGRSMFLERFPDEEYEYSYRIYREISDCLKEIPSEQKKIIEQEKADLLMKLSANKDSVYSKKSFEEAFEKLGAILLPYTLNYFGFTGEESKLLQEYYSENHTAMLRYGLNGSIFDSQMMWTVIDEDTDTLITKIELLQKKLGEARVSKETKSEFCYYKNDINIFTKIFIRQIQREEATLSAKNIKENFCETENGKSVGYCSFVAEVRRSSLKIHTLSQGYCEGSRLQPNNDDGLIDYLDQFKKLLHLAEKRRLSEYYKAQLLRNNQ